MHKRDFPYALEVGKSKIHTHACACVCTHTHIPMQTNHKRPNNGTSMLATSLREDTLDEV